MGFLDRMYVKRKAKLVEDARRHLGDGEVVGFSAICAPEHGLRGLLKGWDQILVIVTDERFYGFAVQPHKNEVVTETMEAWPLDDIEARLDGGTAVVADYRFGPLRVKSEPGELVAFINERKGR